MAATIAPQPTQASEGSVPDSSTAAASLRDPPPRDEGLPQVRVGVYLLDVIAIDDARQEFSADLVVTAHWSDARLIRPDAPAVRHLRYSDIWMPPIDVVNRRGGSEFFPAQVSVDPAGNIRYLQRFQASFASPLDLRAFPNDRQELRVKVVSYGLHGEEVDLVIDQTQYGTNTFSLTGWDVTPRPPRSESVELPSVAAMPGIVLTLDATRNPTFYRLTMGLPLILIALMAWSVFWLDPAVAAARASQISVSTASVFTLITFRLNLNLLLPKVSYLTAADLFILGVTLLVFSSLAEAVLTGALARRGRTDLAHKIDTIGRWIYLAVLVVTTLTVLV